MSPWLRDRITVWLSPRALVLARRRRGLVARNRREVRERAVDPGRSLRDWTPCSAALEAELTAADWRSADLDVHLSDHFVRYVGLEWRDGLRGRADWQTYALHELQRQYGDDAAAYAVRIAPAGRGAPRIAAAVEQSLLETLRAVATRSALRLRSVDTNACRVANRYRRRLAGTARLLVAEPARVTLFDVVDDRWAGVHSVRALGGEALTSLLMESRLRASNAGSGVVLTWGAVENAGALAPLGLALSPLPPPPQTPPGALALGML